MKNNPWKTERAITGASRNFPWNPELSQGTNWQTYGLFRSIKFLYHTIGEGGYEILEQTFGTSLRQSATQSATCSNGQTCEFGQKGVVCVR